MVVQEGFNEKSATAGYYASDGEKAVGAKRGDA
jgi:hypothetical protein